MSTRLRNIKKISKLDGTDGRLIDALIKKLTTYYSLAIRRNINSVEDMKRDVMATYHMCSTDENPRHEYCPPGADSWCKWQKTKATSTDFQLLGHPALLHPDVQKHILPIYNDLSQQEILIRFLGSHTQNANESFNSTVWHLTLKHSCIPA